MIASRAIHLSILWSLLVLVVETNVLGGTAFGKAVSWGSISLPSFSGETKFTQIAAGGSQNLALSTSGVLFAWGDNAWESTTLPTDLSNVVAFSTGGAHSLALLSDGTVRAWG